MIQVLRPNAYQLPVESGYFVLHIVLHINKKGLSFLAKSLIFKWAHLESNQAPTDYESVALTE